MSLGFALGGAFQMFVPLAHGTALRAGIFLLTAQIIGDGFMTIALINDVSLRQFIVPDRLLGRVSATANVLGVAAAPIGALAGGTLGQLASPRAALAGAAFGFSLAALWVVRSPLRTSQDGNCDSEPYGAESGTFTDE